MYLYRNLLIALLGLVVNLPLTLASGYEDVPATSVFKGQQGRYGHLQYFGFYASGMHQWNFTAELADFTNLTWIEVPKIDDLVQRVREAKENGISAVLSVQPFVFDSHSKLKPEYPLILAEIQQRLEGEGLIDVLAMIYPIDEPYLRVSSSRKSNRNQMYRDLLEVNREVRELFPGKPIGVIFNNKEVVRSDFKIPPSYRWVGFDCYENMYDCKGKPFSKYYGILLDHMTHKQRLMAVPQTWVKHSDYERRSYEPRAMYQQRIDKMATDLDKRLKHHYEIALSDPRFVAVIPFLWSMEVSAGKPQHSGFGVDRFSEMFPAGGEAFLETLISIGRDVKSGSQAYTNLSRQQTEFSLRRRLDSYEGAVLNIDRRGFVSAWAVNRALPHKNLRMQVFVHESGDLIYRSPVRRSFILDDSLRTSFSPNLPVVGIHGYRQKLPANISAAVTAGAARLSVRVYGDTNSLQDYHELGH